MTIFSKRNKIIAPNLKIIVADDMSSKQNTNMSLNLKFKKQTTHNLKTIKKLNI